MKDIEPRTGCTDYTEIYRTFSGENFQFLATFSSIYLEQPPVL